MYLLCYCSSTQMHGSVLAVGAPDSDGFSGNETGHVRVYAWDGSNYMQRGRDIDGEAAGGRFGANHK